MPAAFHRIAALCTLACAAAQAEPARLDPLFGEHMVLQRDQPIRVWGTADAGAQLQLALAGHTAAASAGADGAWSVDLPALPAGGPHRLTLSQQGMADTRVDDVLVGDVFLCSGQSNMEWPLSRASGAWGELLAGDPAIRLLTVAKDSAPAPLADLTHPAQWLVADAEAAQGFSAVCWLMAKELRKTSDVPFGLINASWGGSQLEAWMSAESLAAVGGFDAQLELLATYAGDRAAGLARYGAQWEAWWRGHSPGAAPWETGQSTADWKPVPEAMGDWNQYGDADIAGFNGMLWFRREFTLDAAQAAQAAALKLGPVDEVDTSWVNGRFAGAQFGWGTPREYALPAGMLRAGRNSVTVNVLNTWGQGGLIGPGAELRLELADGSVVPLAGDWRYSRVPPQAGMPPRTPWESVGGLTGMYNAMLAPLAGLRLAGAAWYQGESNAGRGRAYGPLLVAMIRGWRALFAAPELPFVAVQLPGFGALGSMPAESGWAELRESQRQVALSDPHTGLASVMDVGDPFDIHPTNKQVVGRRVAEVMRALAFGGPGLADGLSAITAWRDGGEVVVDFTAAGELPVVRGSGQPAGFELCGEAPGSCAWASAHMDGALVRLSGANAGSATWVRHAWADAPIVNLYSQGGLPVGSFEVTIRD